MDSLGSLESFQDYPRRVRIFKKISGCSGFVSGFVCFSGILAVDFSGFFSGFFRIFSRFFHDFFRINSGFCYFLRVSDETLNWLSLDSLQLLRILQDSSINPKHSLRGILSFLSFLLSFFPSFLLSFFPSFLLSTLSQTSSAIISKRLIISGRLGVWLSGWRRGWVGECRTLSPEP